jgi:hypothetical protein
LLQIAATGFVQKLVPDTRKILLKEKNQNICLFLATGLTSNQLDGNNEAPFGVNFYLKPAYSAFKLLSQNLCLAECLLLPAFNW